MNLLGRILDLEKQMQTRFTNWQAYVPTGNWVANSTYAGFWRRTGDTLWVRAQVALGGAPTSAAFSLSIPGDMNLQIDTNKLPAGLVANNLVLGIGSLYDATGSSWQVYVRYLSATTVTLATSDDGTNGGTYVGVDQATPFTFANSDRVTLEFQVPIVGWK